MVNEESVAYFEGLRVVGAIILVYCPFTFGPQIVESKGFVDCEPSVFLCSVNQAVGVIRKEEKGRRVSVGSVIPFKFCEKGIVSG